MDDDNPKQATGWNPRPSPCRNILKSVLPAWTAIGKRLPNWQMIEFEINLAGGRGKSRGGGGGQALVATG